MENVHPLPIRASQRSARPAHESDTDYYLRRAREERAVAAQARDARSRGLHLEIAALYEDLARTLGDGRSRLG